MERQVQAYADDFINHIETLHAYDEPPQNTELPPSGGRESHWSPLLVKSGKVDRAGINPASGGHLGYVPGGGIFRIARAITSPVHQPIFRAVLRQSGGSAHRE